MGISMIPTPVVDGWMVVVWMVVVWIDGCRIDRSLMVNFLLFGNFRNNCQQWANGKSFRSPKDNSGVFLLLYSNVEVGGNLSLISSVLLLSDRSYRFSVLVSRARVSLTLSQ